MALYTIGDLHLSFSVDKPMDIFGAAWKNHTKVLEANWRAKIQAEDTVVLVGDHSWALKPEDAVSDLTFIHQLPGRKILTRGNHDMFWDVKKTRMLNELYQPELTFVQDSYDSYQDYAIVATKGFTFEGPFYIDRRGRIVGWDEEEEEHSRKLVARELVRLRKSFDLAKADGYRKFIMFLHYPPTSILEERSGFTDMADEFGAEQVIYAHSHGESRFHDSIHGEYRGREYHLVSGDYLRWKPLKIL